MLRPLRSVVLLIPFILGIPAFSTALVTPSAETLQAVNFNLYATRRLANDMPLTDLAGNTISLDSLKGKVVILNFWRIDCPPCAAEKPLLEKLYRKYAQRGLEILAVNLSDSPDRIKDYVTHGGYSFLFGHDPLERLSLKRHVFPSGAATSFVVNSRSEAIYEITGVPTSYLIDREGRLVGQSIGLTHWERGPLHELLESLLGPRTLSASNPQLYSPRAVIQTRAQVAATPLNEPLKGWQGETPQAPAQSGKVVLAQHPLPLEGDTAPKSPVVVPPSAPAPPVSPPEPRSRATTVAPVPRTGGTPGRVTPQVRRPSGAPYPSRTAPRRQTPGQAYRPAAPGATLPPARVQRTPLARSVRPNSSPQPPASDQLPELPKALPYTGGGNTTRANPVGQRVNLDNNGYVTARVPRPGRSSQSRTERNLPGIPEAEPISPASTGRNALPPAETVQPPNPIGGFILESFAGSSRALPPVTGQPLRVQPRMQQPMQPAAQPLDRPYEGPSLLGSIRDTLSRINPF